MPRVAHTLRSTLFAAALVLAAWAAVVAITGGTVVTLGPVRISSRAPGRPAFAALLLAAAMVATASAEQRRRGLVRARDLTDRAAPWLAALLAVALGATSALLNEHAPAGADSSGYLRQSRMWAAGEITLAAPVVTADEWPLRGWLVSPLGFAPSVVPDRLGPSYAPGLPWLMAAGAAVLGEPGRFVWTPIASALLVWLTFCLTRRAAPPTVGLAAGVLVATSPPVLFAAMQTMSDLLCAALWTAAVLAMTRGGARTTALAGVASGLALAVRPNLVPLAALVGLTAVATAAGSWRTRLQHAALLALPMAAAAIAVAAINSTLWGSPFASGYGATDDLFIAERVPGNIARLWRWTRETGGLWLLPGLAAIAWLAASQRRREWWLGLAIALGVAVSYLPYAFFEEWWYFRFYLPAWPFAAGAVATATWLALRRLSAPLAPFLVLAAALAFVPSALAAATGAGTFDLWRGAQRYAAVAGHLATAAPRDALVLSVQHSGALHYHGHHIGRWDFIASDGLDGLVRTLAAGGRQVWLVADDFEVVAFRARFAGTRGGALDWAPVAEVRNGAGRTYVYDLTSPTRAVAPALLPLGRRSRWPWAR